MSIKFWPGRPKFPIIIDIGRGLIVARTGAECEKKFLREEVRSECVPVIDAAGDGFEYYPEKGLITSLTIKTSWKKAEIIELYNSRREPGAPEYRIGSLDGKTKARILADIAGLLIKR